nr:TPA: orf y [Tanacetum cinerariifolium]
MSLANVKETTEYQEAIQATEEVESPAVGFAKTSDYKGGLTNQVNDVVKQNNTLLYLASKQSQKLIELEEKFDRLKQKVHTIIEKEIQPADLEDSISSLAKRLDSFLISELPTQEDQIHGYRAMTRGRYQEAGATRRVFGRNNYNITLESVVDPERQLELSRERRANLVPAEVLYSNNRNDFHNHVEVSIQTHGYDTWQGGESNLLVTMAMIGRLSNTSYMGFQYSVDNVVDHLTTTGITVILGERRSVKELEGMGWNLKPSEQTSAPAPSRVAVNERLNRSLSLQFERYRQVPQPVRYSVDQHDREILDNDHLDEDEEQFKSACKLLKQNISLVIYQDFIDEYLAQWDDQLAIQKQKIKMKWENLFAMKCGEDHTVLHRSKIEEKDDDLPYPKFKKFKQVAAQIINKHEEHAFQTATDAVASTSYQPLPDVIIGLAVYPQARHNPQPTYKPDYQFGYPQGRGNAFSGGYGEYHNSQWTLPPAWTESRVMLVLPADPGLWKKYGIRKSRTYKGKPHNSHVKPFKRKYKDDKGRAKKCKCFICGKERHFAKDCRSKQGNIARSDVYQELDLDDNWDIVSADFDDSNVYSMSKGEGDVHQNISIMVQDTPFEEAAFMTIKGIKESDDEQSVEEDYDDQNIPHAFMFHHGPPTKIADMVQSAGLWKLEKELPTQSKSCEHDWKQNTVTNYIICYYCGILTTDMSRLNYPKCQLTTCSLCARNYLGKTVNVKGKQPQKPEEEKDFSSNEVRLLKELLKEKTEQVQQMIRDQAKEYYENKTSMQKKEELWQSKESLLIRDLTDALKILKQLKVEQIRLEEQKDEEIRKLKTQLQKEKEEGQKIKTSNETEVAEIAELEVSEEEFLEINESIYCNQEGNKAVLEQFKPVIDRLKHQGYIREEPLKHWKKNGELCKLDIINPNITIEDRPLKHVTPAMEYSFKKQVDSLLKISVIRPSKSRHRTMAMIVNLGTTIDPVTGREVKGKERMVFSYKSLNNNTYKDQYSLPGINTIIKRIEGAKIFSQFDLKSWFHQVAMDEESIPWTAFLVPGGLYEWIVMTFGLKMSLQSYNVRPKSALENPLKTTTGLIKEKMSEFKTKKPEESSLNWKPFHNGWAATTSKPNEVQAYNSKDNKCRNNRKGFLEDDDNSDDLIFILYPGWDDYSLQELKLNHPVPCCPNARRARM